MFCGSTTLVKRVDGGIAVIPCPCHSWTCEDCAPGRTARLVYEVKLGRPDLFITLTSRVIEGGSPALAAQRLAHAWRDYRRRYIKKHGKGSLPFIAVFEQTKKGWPHLHIAARSEWVDHAELSAFMAAAINSPNVWVERLDSFKKIAAYLAKYMAKNPHRFKGTKRYWRSQDYLLPVPGSGGNDDLGAEDWKHVGQYWLDYIDESMSLGFRAEFSRSYALLTWEREP